MDESDSNLPSESDIQETNTSNEAKKPFWGGITRRRAAAVVAGAAIAGGTSAGAELSRASKPAVEPDRTFQSYGTEGNPAPSATIDQASGRIEQIRFVPSNNPYELTNQLLWLMGKNIIVSRYWNGVLVLPAGTVLEHTPGNDNLMLNNQSNDGEADKLVVPEGHVLVCDNPRLFGYKSDYLNMSPEGSDHSATNIDENYWLKLESALENPKAVWLERKGEFGTVDDGGVDSKGNPTFPPAPTSQVASFKIIKTTELPEFEKQNNLAWTNQQPSSY